MECKNCHTNFSDENNFCPNCGGKIIRNRLTLKSLFAHFSEQFLNYDNKFLKTFLHLFTKPEIVINGYINGTRKKYVNVISYFAIAITISGLHMFILNKFFPEVLDLSSIENKSMMELQKKNIDVITEYQSLIMMLSVPLYALLSKIVFFNIKKYNYTEHLIIFMYISAQISIVGAMLLLFLSLLNISFITASTVIFPFYIIYSAYCLKHLYKLSLKSIFLRTLFFLLITLILYIITSIIVIAILYSTGGLDSFMESQRALQNN